MNLADHLATVLTVIGHISFALTFASYAQRDIIKLRMIAVAGLVCGLLYNGWVQSKMTGEDNIWLVLFWLSVFLAQNVYLLVKEIRAGLELSLPADSRTLMVTAFPSMHSRDWDALVKLAVVRTFAKGSTILEVGEATKSLQVIVSGFAVECRNGLDRICDSGTLWGELTFIMGQDQYNASPVKIVATTDVVVYSWPYSDLRKACEKNLRLTAALHHGFITSAGLKHGLLWNEAQVQRSNQSPTHGNA